MNKLTPNFGQYIAECCIKEKYNGKLSSDDYYALANFCEFENYKKDDHLHECFYKMQRLYINSVATNLVIDNLPVNQQSLLFYYYKRKLNILEISYRLYMSTATISRLRKEILSKVENALFYRISPDDIFERYKLLGLINLIDSRLIHLQEVHNELVKNLDKSLVKQLLEKKKKYTILLQYINRCIIADQEAEHQDYYLYCIACKLKHPHENISALAEKIKRNPCFVSQKLKEYKATINSFIQ